MNLEFEYLADHPEQVDRVIAWWHTVWSDRMGPLDQAARQLAASLNTDSLPIQILATVDGEPVGTAVLKLQELAELFPDKQYWMGSVYVDESHRGASIASRLAERIIELAENRGLPHLYLQTVNASGGLYARLGWEPLQLFDYRGERTLLMVRKLKGMAA
jgi:GNAT superfamily N-acetyltransferase